MKRRDVDNKEIDMGNHEFLVLMVIAIVAYIGLPLLVFKIMDILVFCGMNVGDMLFMCVILLIIVCSSRAFEDWKDRL